MMLRTTPLDLAELIGRVTAPDRGAVVTFLGVVRDHHQGRAVVRLEYSAYPEMAEAEAGRIVREAEGRWPVRVAVAHRIGVLDIGEPAVAIAVAGAHRDEAFAACRFLIEELKARVPIWKRERYVDGSEAWVDPTAQEGCVPAASKTPHHEPRA